MNIIGRKLEQKTLSEIFNSPQAELIAVYGRRRVGKTFLIREFFSNKKCIFFNATGMQNGKKRDQIENFMDRFIQTFYADLPAPELPKTWRKTLGLLNTVIQKRKSKHPIIIFLDEFPWMATPKSKLLETFDYFWNQYWSMDPRIKIILCGSSAAWIIKNIINNKGGLHNRITGKILLRSFCLSEVKEFLYSNGIVLHNKHIINIYMLTGGVPYYLGLVKKGLSAVEIIQQIAFSKDSILFDEFENLFRSLFKNYQIYIDIVLTIAQNRYGIMQKDIFNNLPQYSLDGDLGLKCLDDLEKAGFIISFTPYSHNKRGTYYRVIDMFILFYLKWIAPIKKGLIAQNIPVNYWASVQNTPGWFAWSGYAFESICYNHIHEIAKCLSLPTSAIPSTWRYAPRKGGVENGAQIDLLFDRDDDAITICEVKYTIDPYVLDKADAHNLLNKSKVFVERTGTKKQIFYALISANGAKETLYAREYISKVVTAEDLFN